MSAIYVHFNGNPCGMSTGDCVIRAISIVTGYDRHKVYCGICIAGYPCTIWGDSNAIWAEYLQSLGFRRHTVTDSSTVAEFAVKHPNGRYVVGTGNHAVAVIDGDWVDSWDSGNEKPRYYFVKE